MRRSAILSLFLGTALGGLVLLGPGWLNAGSPAPGRAAVAPSAASGDARDLLAAGEPFVQIVARSREAVVAVGIYRREDAASIQYSGTGFVVDDGTVVVTNAHVVEAVRQVKRLEHLRVFFPDHDEPGKATQTIGRAVTVWAEDPHHDLALLKLEGPAQPRVRALALPREAPVLQGQSVGVVGYPVGTALGVVPAAHRGVVAAVVPAVLPLPDQARPTPELLEAIRRPYHLYQLDLVVMPGNSGSPLLDANDGRVVGVVNKALGTRTREHLLREPTGIAYAVPVRWAAELLARARAASGPSTQPGRP